jgi:ATP-dependent RNA helicase DDX55/SPB4
MYLCCSASQEAVEALARAGLRNPVKVAVAVTAAPAAAADGSSKKRKQQDGQQQEGAAAAGAALEQKTPTSLSLQYIMCSVDEKLPQLVSSCCIT